MIRMLIILPIILGHLTTILAQPELTINDSLKAASLASDIYSVQINITCQGNFFMSNDKQEINCLTFSINGTACRINSHLITILYLVDTKANLKTLLEFLIVESSRQSGTLQIGLINQITIERKILSYWGAVYSMTETLACSWPGVEIDSATVEKMINQARTIRLDTPIKSFKISNHDKLLNIAVLTTDPPLKPGKLKFGEADGVDGHERLIGINAAPLNVPRSFFIITDAGYLIDTDYGPYDLTLINMPTTIDNIGDPIFSLKNKKLIGITICLPAYKITQNTKENQRLIVPAEKIEKFYNNLLLSEQ